MTNKKRIYWVTNLVYVVNMLACMVCGAVFNVRETVWYGIWALSQYVVFLLAAMTVENAVGCPIDELNERMVTWEVCIMGLYTPSIICGFMIPAWGASSPLFWVMIGLFLVLSALPVGLTLGLSRRVAGDPSVVSGASVEEFDAIDPADVTGDERMRRGKTLLGATAVLAFVAYLMADSEWRYVSLGVTAACGVAAIILHILAMRTLYRAHAVRRSVTGSLRLLSAFALLALGNWLFGSRAPTILYVWLFVVLWMHTWLTRRRITTVLEARRVAREGGVEGSGDAEDEDEWTEEVAATEPDENINGETGGSDYPL